jgi:hypothetical protein
MAKGIIDSVIDSESIARQLKELSSLFKELQGNVEGLGEAMAIAFKEIKKSSDFLELSKNLENFNSKYKDFENNQKEMRRTLDSATKLQEMQTEAYRQQAIEAAKTRLQIQEYNKEIKNTAQAQISAGKAADNYAAVLNKSAKSIAEMKEQNRQLRRIVETLDVNTQSDEIQKLNKVIDGNTAIIKINSDSYVQQKMNIGNYVSALDGLDAKIALITADMQKMEASGTGTDNEQYREMVSELEDLNAQVSDYTKKLRDAQSEADAVGAALAEVRLKMQDLNAAQVINGSLNDEQKKEYAELREQAEKLGKAMKRTSDEMKELAQNNLALRGWNDSLQLITAGTQLAQKTMQDLGLSTESYAEILVQLQQAQATINSLEQISNLLRAKSTMQIALQSAAESQNVVIKYTAVAAQKALNLAQKAMPFLAAGMVFLQIGKWLSNLISGTSEAEKWQKDLNKAQKEAIGTIAKQAASIKILQQQVAKGNLSQLEQISITKQLNEQLKNTGKEFKTFAEAQEWLVQNSQNYIDALIEQAKAEALRNEYVKTYQQLLNERMKAQQKEQQFYEKYNMTVQEAAQKNKIFAEAIKEMYEEADEAQKKLDWLFSQMGKNVDFDGFEKEYNDLMKSIDDSNKTAEQKQAEQVKTSEQKINNYYDSLIKKHETTRKTLDKLPLGLGNFVGAGMGTPDDTADLQAKRDADLQKLRDQDAEKTRKKNEEIAKQQRDMVNKSEDLKIRIMQDSFAKQQAELEQARKKELQTEKLSAQDRLNINTYYDQQIEKARADNDAKIVEAKRINIDNQLAVVAAGSEAEYNLTLKSLQLQEDAEIAAAEKSGADIVAIYAKYDAMRNDAINTWVEARVTKTMEAEEKRLAILDANMQKELDAQLAMYKSGEINREQYNKNIAEIEKRYSDQALQDQIDNLRAIINTLNLTAEQRAEIEKQITDLQKQQAKERADAEIKSIDDVNKQRKKAAEMAKEYSKQLTEAVIGFAIQQSEQRVETIQAEIDKINEQRDLQLEALDEAIMSEETRAAEEKRINDEAAAQTAALEEKKKQEQLKAFRMQQVAAVAQTAINTAQAIMQVWAQVPPYAAPALTAVVAALGAVQTATILAQKPPQYAEGIFGNESHGGGLAIVGDAGKREYAILPSGKVWETPSTSTLVNLPKFTQVLPDFDTFQKYINPIPDFDKNINVSVDMRDFKDEMIAAIRSSQATQNVTLNIDNNGITSIVLNKNSQKRVLNTKYRARL